jgi:hypothetical protein
MEQTMTDINTNLIIDIEAVPEIKAIETDSDRVLAEYKVRMEDPHEKNPPTSDDLIAHFKDVYMRYTTTAAIAPCVERHYNSILGTLEERYLRHRRSYLNEIGGFRDARDDYKNKSAAASDAYFKLNGIKLGIQLNPEIMSFEPSEDRYFVQEAGGDRWRKENDNA